MDIKKEKERKNDLHKTINVCKKETTRKLTVTGCVLAAEKSGAGERKRIYNGVV